MPTGEITKDAEVDMRYLNHYETKVVHRYGVELVGWPLDKMLVDGLSTNNLQIIVDGMANGSIYWAKLTEGQLIARIEAWRTRDVTKDVKAKKRIRKKQKVQKGPDLGEPRSVTAQSVVMEETITADSEEPPPA